MNNLVSIEINAKNCQETWAQRMIEKYSNLIAERVQAFADKGINQWQDNYAQRNNSQNVTNTLLSDGNKNLVLVFDSEDKVVGGCMLKSVERPGFWDDGNHNLDVKAWYIAGLVSDPKRHGLGKPMMEALGNYARECGIEVIRLDCKSELGKKSFLDRFYESVGFVKVGGGYKEPNEKFSEYRYSLYEATPDQLIDGSKKTEQKREV